MNARSRPPHERSHAERCAWRDGDFAHESIIRRVGSTPVPPFLGGGTAVLLQVAHPLVAVGVAEHSDFRHDLWRRLARTLRALYLITFGTKLEADQAGAAVQKVHEHVHGATRERLGAFPAGTTYAADDPELMLWVHATLVQSSLSAYQRFQQQLSPEDQERYYREMAVVARVFGTPASIIPGSLAEFRDYFSERIDSDTISITPAAREIAEVILQAPLPLPMQLLGPAHRLATAAQLPPRLRREYALSWTPAHSAALTILARPVKLAAWPMLLAAARLRPPTAAASY
jgi:uncharacterized protein (DUF2236 family)